MSFPFVVVGVFATKEVSQIQNRSASIIRKELNGGSGYSIVWFLERNYHGPESDNASSS